jgi:hypothetical protein
MPSDGRSDRVFADRGPGTWRKSPLDLAATVIMAANYSFVQRGHAVRVNTTAGRPLSCES